jgi:hypothetical protein
MRKRHGYHVHMISMFTDSMWFLFVANRAFASVCTLSKDIAETAGMRAFR